MFVFFSAHSSCLLTSTHQPATHFLWSLSSVYYPHACCPSVCPSCSSFTCSILLLTCLNSPACYPLPVVTFFCLLSSCLMSFWLSQLLIFHLFNPPAYLPQLPAHFLLFDLLLIANLLFIPSSCSYFTCSLLLLTCLQLTCLLLSSPAHFPSVDFPPSCSPSPYSTCSYFSCSLLLITCLNSPACFSFPLFTFSFSFPFAHVPTDNCTPAYSDCSSFSCLHPWLAASYSSPYYSLSLVTFLLLTFLLFACLNSPAYYSLPLLTFFCS